MPGILRCCATLVAGKCHANGRRRFEPTRDLDTRRQHERSTLCRLLALDDLFSYSPWVQSSESSAEYGLIDLCRVLSFPLFFLPKAKTLCRAPALAAAAAAAAEAARRCACRHRWPALLRYDMNGGCPRSTFAASHQPSKHVHPMSGTSCTGALFYCLQTHG